MMPNSRPANLRSKLGRLARSKTMIVACLLSSTALVAEPQVAQARDGMNGFVAGAILGGAMRGLAGPGPRFYRGSRTSRRTAHHHRGKRSKDQEETAESAPAEKASGSSRDIVIDNTASGNAASAAAASGATTSSAPASDSGSSSARSSRRNGRRGPGGLETVKSGLD